MNITTKKIIISILVNLIFCMSVSAINDALKIKILKSPSVTDETVIRFLPNATNGFDGNYDAYKMFSSSTTVPSIYTNIDAVTHMSINALPSFNSQMDIELFIKIQVAGSYTIQSTELGTGFLASVKIVLEDKETGLFYNFRNGTNLSFMINITNSNTENRFTIHFSPQMEVTPNNVSCNGLNDGMLNLNKSGNHNWNYELKNNSSAISFIGNNIDQTATVSNLASGTYTLYTQSNTTLSDTTLITIVEPAAVIANFTADNENVFLSDATIIFNNTSSNAVSYSWSFGDGDTSDSVSTVHQYTSAGSYIVSLTAENTNGCSSTFSKIINVNQEVTTGINNYSNESTYLNAQQIDGELQLDLHLTSLSNVIIHVYNTYGQMIYTYSDEHSGEISKKLPVNISATYIINSIVNNVSHSQKITFLK